ncbi:hypothetical protein ABT160_40945 [Streptomyces sp. NPDC001941]|uniref:hypothetical protein n=1 Tax=Streptomyces sp. NPDC001941 TaxID=3154659 RepID=UPI00332D9A00
MASAWRFAEDYFEVPVDVEAVRRVRALNPEVRLRDLAGDMAEIGYPLPSRQP